MLVERRDRRGNIVIIFGASLTAILLIGALVMDISWARVARIQTQQAADAGAHAGASQLDETTAGIYKADTLALAVTEDHAFGGASVEASTTTAGFWDASAKTFTPVSDPTLANAYHVTATRPDLAGFFGRAAGIESMTIQSEATALVNYRGAGGVACYMPLAMPKCLVDLAGGKEGLDDFDLALNNANVDTVGYGLVNQSVSASNVRSQINSSGFCGDGAVEAGENVGLMNGQTRPVLSAILDLIVASPTVWNPAVWGEMPAQDVSSTVPVLKYGRIVEGPIIVFEDNSTTCGSDSQFNQAHPIVAFVWAAVYDVNDGGASTGMLKVRLDTSKRVMGTRPGGEDLGMMVGGSGTLVQ